MVQYILWLWLFVWTVALNHFSAPMRLWLAFENVSRHNWSSLPGLGMFSLKWLSCCRVWMSSFSKREPSGFREAEHIWNSSAETESSGPAWCILGVINPDLKQLNILPTKDGAAVSLHSSAKFTSPYKPHTLTLSLILSWCQGHASTLSYIRVDFASCGEPNPFSYRVSQGETKELSSRLCPCWVTQTHIQWS